MTCRLPADYGPVRPPRSTAQRSVRRLVGNLVLHVEHQTGIRPSGDKLMTTPHQQLELPTRSLELFTGAGGLALGTHLAGFQHVALVEWNKDACRTLEANVRARAVPGIEEWRVISIDAGLLAFDAFGEVDLVAGGPPCQPFS